MKNNFIKNLKINAKLTLVAALFICGFIIFGGYSLFSMHEIKVNGPIYKQIILQKDLLADILPPPEYVIESYLTTVQLYLATDDAEISRLIEKGDGLRKNFEDRHAYWKKALPEGPGKDLLVKDAYDTAEEFFNARDKEFVPAILQRNTKRYEHLFHEVMEPIYEKHRLVIDKIVVSANVESKNIETQANKMVKKSNALLVAVAGVIVLIVFIITRYITKIITDPLSSITQVATEMAGGRLDASSLAGITSRRDEIGILAGAFMLMTGQLTAALEGLRKSHDELEMRVQERTSELKKSNEQLELEVAERTRAEAVLNIRSQELTRSNAELGMFAYVASHDLQEPLRMVASYLQLVDTRYREHLDADAHEFIAFAVDGARRMQVLINDLLAYSRIGTRGQAFQPTDCEAVLQTAMQNLQVAIRESGAQITHALLPAVIGDATQLVQLFQNLIGNALKFRRDEPPQIHIHAELKGGFWCLSVQDNGIGIESEYFDRIFVVFQRLHGRVAYPGTGIGLAICKYIVERHGGTIWVESEFGKGSTFHFTLSKSGGNAMPAGLSAKPTEPGQRSPNDET